MPGRTILIVDDAPLFRELEAIFLAKTGRVLTAQAGAEALELARRERPDVMVVDLEMPGLPGDAVCREVRADPALAGTPLILVTDGERPEDRARAIRAGADDVLAKPLNRIELIQAVSRFVRFPQQRALARVDLCGPALLRHERSELEGRCRNVSRGGMFVESVAAPERAEVLVRFELPDGSDPIEPTAVVRWQRRADARGPAGLGLQFLRLDRRGAERIDDFVHERSAAIADPAEPGLFLPR